MDIKSLVIDLSKDPFNPEKNFAVAVQYEKDNQTASAVSFYLRTIEYGFESHPIFVYTSLLKLAHCFEDQKDRAHTVSNALLQALAYRPQAPEAYFLLSQFYERSQAWQESYTFAVLGLQITDYVPTPIHVGYYGRFCLVFEKAVSAYWIGRKDESIALFKDLATLDLPTEYKNSVSDNLRRLNVTL